jgi:uridine kinase
MSQRRQVELGVLTHVRQAAGDSSTAPRAAISAEPPTDQVRVPDVRQLVSVVGGWQASRSAITRPLVVAIDGHGASGKSTVARTLTAEMPAALVHTDDFFRPTAEMGGVRQSIADYYDWQRLRAEALGPLFAGHSASFRRFDWDSSALGGLVTVASAELILLEGVFSAAPVLSDMVDRAIFVETPEPERIRRLRQLIAPEEWDDDWLAAERAYFCGTRPPSSFDLVVPGTPGSTPCNSVGAA